MNAAAIAHALRHAQRTGDGWIASCPLASHGQGKGDRHPSLSIKDGARGILVTCHAGCSAPEVLDALRQRGLLDDRRQISGDAPTYFRTPKSSAYRTISYEPKPTQAIAARLWDEARPIPDTGAETYLIEHRGLDVRALDLAHCLRWHAGIGAMVALMTDAISNEPVGVHRTFLNPDGSKRERKMLGRAGVIRLDRDEDVAAEIGVAEGVEKSLAIMLDGWRPMWCAGSANGIAKFPVLSGVESLVIFADDGEPGASMAAACARRWEDAGREVIVARPSEAV